MSVTSSLKIHGVGSETVTLDSEKLIRLSADLYSSIGGGEIVVDTLDALVYESDAMAVWTQSKRGTEIDYYEGETLVESFYISELSRTAKRQWKISAQSALGLLDGINHYGGVYGDTTVEEIVDEIIGNIFTYTIEQEVKSWVVSGWLPYDTARNNLHRFLLAMGLNITRDEYGKPHIGKLTSNDPIVVENAYLGGTINRQTPATDISVLESRYYALPATEPISLFDNTGGTGSEEVTVVFNQPCFGLESSAGLEILSSGANYATVIGTGRLLGKPYTKTERVVSLSTETNNAAEKKINISDDGLVNPLNSINVASKVLSYYSIAETHKGRMVWDDVSIRPGNVVQITDVYGDTVQGFLTKLHLSISNVNAADFEIVPYYSPGPSGNSIKSMALITESGEWTSPVERIRIILVGGGQGGQGGYNGEKGGGEWGVPPIWIPEHRMEYHEKYDEDTDRIIAKYCFYPDGSTRKSGGAGGLGGRGGQPGSVLVIDAEVTPGEVLTFSLGAGGSGGSVGGEMGADGTASTVSSYTIGTRSSAEGSKPTYGVLDLFGGNTLATLGADGRAGGNGGISTLTSAYGWDGGDGAPGDGVGSHAGGSGGAGYKYIHVYAQTGEEVYQISAGGGGGGGSSNAANGDPGGSATASATSYYWYEGTCRGGDGGNGADASAADVATLGSGGNGGNGGGGGGDAGGSTARSFDGHTWEMSGADIEPGTPGNGGRGSAGANGGNGFALIYYGFDDDSYFGIRTGNVNTELDGLAHIVLQRGGKQAKGNLFSRWFAMMLAGGKRKAFKETYRMLSKAAMRGVSRAATRVKRVLLVLIGRVQINTSSASSAKQREKVSFRGEATGNGRPAIDNAAGGQHQLSFFLRVVIFRFVRARMKSELQAASRAKAVGTIGTEQATDSELQETPETRLDAVAGTHALTNEPGAMNAVSRMRATSLRIAARTLTEKAVKMFSKLRLKITGAWRTTAATASGLATRALMLLRNQAESAKAIIGLSSQVKGDHAEGARRAGFGEANFAGEAMTTTADAVDSATSTETAFRPKTAMSVLIWEYPILSGNDLIITQVNSANLVSDILDIA